jgi:hypothetical protein
MPGPRGGGSGALGFVLLCACGWFGLYCLGNLRDLPNAPAPAPPANTDSAPGRFPLSRPVQEPVEPPDAFVPAPDPGADDPDDPA